MNWFLNAGMIMLCGLLSIRVCAQTETGALRPLEMAVLEKDDRVILYWKMDRDTGTSIFVIERSQN